MAPTYLTFVRERPAWLLFMILGRLLLARRIERAILGAPHAAITSRQESRVTIDTPSTVISRLVRDGAAEGFRLKDEDVAEIQAFARANPCFEYADGISGFLPGDLAAVNASRDHDVASAFYFDTVQRCPAIVRLGADPLLQQAADAYLGRATQLIRTRLWWNFPGERLDDAELHATAQDSFHFDMNDWSTLKFFFYLTPTTARSGAHRYIVGSHKRRRLRHQFTLTVGHPLEEIIAYYGADAIRTIPGAPGEGFAEDPFVFHTGARCLDDQRLILELEYGCAPPSPSYRFGARL